MVLYVYIYLTNGLNIQYIYIGIPTYQIRILNIDF
jgi:hypothetical protein